jgi:hypothetical protein
MPHPKQLSRADILRTARVFTWTRKMPKWTVVIENRVLPARPLVLQAAGVRPNDSTNSHQAVAILEDLGFDTRYEGVGEKTSGVEETSLVERPNALKSIFDFVQEISKNIPEEAWDNVPTDLAINVDHYLYGHRKTEE